MNVLTFDFECTTWNKGSPFDQRNFAVCLAIKWLGEDHDCYVKYIDWDIQRLQFAFDKADLLVAFNAKFDLHWLRKVGIIFAGKRIWDCQLGEFILENQSNPYPSLENTAVKYGLGHKIDIIKNEYWDKGINTDAIPREVLTPYVEQDVYLTEQVYLKQLELFNTEHLHKKALFSISCQDLLVLEEMEWNGIKFDVENALKKATELQGEEERIYKQLQDLIGGINFNPNSGDHLSAILYGGIIEEEFRIPVGNYKSGKKVGEVRYKVVTKQYELPRLVEPEGVPEIKKPEGSPKYWQTNADILRTLKLKGVAKKIVALISEYAKIEKLRGTYLTGWSNMIEKMGWEPNTIHGQLNQCVVITGRLSSSKPNLQNADPATKVFCVSRYDN